MKPLPPDFDPEESALLDSLGGAPFGPVRSAHCPPATMIQALLAGALPEQDSAPMLGHIHSCPACTAVYSALAGLEPHTAGTGEIDQLWTRIKPHLAPRRRFSWHWIWIPAAAAAAVAITVLSPALFKPEPSFIAFRPPAPASPTLPGWQTRDFDKPPVRLPAGGLLLWRGSGADPLPESTRQLAQALEPYRNGDLNEAERRLAGLASRYPDSFEIPFYRGVCLLYLNRPGARDLLARARDLGSETQSNEASWYIALSLLQDRSIGQARPMLETLCSSVSSRSDSACRILGQFSEVRFNSAGR